MAQTEQGFIEQIRLCLTKGHTPTLKEFSSFSIFFKQILGFIIGMLLGFLKVTGMVGMVIYLAIALLSTQFYSKNYLEIDEDEIENSTIFKEGTFQGFVCFILFWILSFTLFHYS